MLKVEKGKFRCTHCNEKFARNTNLINHEWIAHKKNVKKVKCPLWPKCANVHKATGLYSTRENLKVHLKKHHKSFNSRKFNKLKLESIKVPKNSRLNGKWIRTCA